MTLPIANHYFKLENKGIAAALFAFDAAAPITLLVVGILASFSILSVSHAGAYATLAVGGGVAVFNFIAWAVFCAKRKKSSESPANSGVFSDTKTSSMPGWDQKVYCSSDEKREKIIKALQKKNPNQCPFRWILFFQAHSHTSDLLFTPGDGHFKDIFGEIKTSNQKVLVFMCPQDEDSERRVTSKDYLGLLCGTQTQVRELKSSGKLEVIPLSCHESYVLNGIEHNGFPSKVKKALGFGWF